MIEQDDSYEAIAETSWDDIPEPRVLPKGTWKLKGKNAKRMPGGEGSNPYVLFFYKPVEPMSDVDDADLDALGKDYDFNINDLSFRIYTETSADFKKVEKFLAKHGIVPAKSEETGKAEGIDATLKKFKGAEVLSVLGKRTFKDNTGELRTDNTLTAFASVLGDEA